MRRIKDMSNVSLDEISARFYLAFKALSRDDTETQDRAHFIDIFANYLYPPVSTDYIDGEVNELSPSIIFISSMLEENANHRDIVFKELEDNEDYELLKLLMNPVGTEVELIVDNLQPKQIKEIFKEY